MYPLLLFSVVLINFVIANELNYTNHGSELLKQGATENKMVMGIPLWKQHFWKPHKSKMSHNTSYIDKAENMIRLPAINQFEEKRKKFLRKSPKRTIQKIIKKKQQRTKRIYVVKVHSSSTSPSAHYDKGQDDMSAWKDDQTTLATNQRKKPKKYNSKVARYPMPFQKLQKKKFNKREKRNTFDREDFYILKDFDELKFLKSDKDLNVVQTHVKKYW